MAEEIDTYCNAVEAITLMIRDRSKIFRPIICKVQKNLIAVAHAVTYHVEWGTFGLFGRSLTTIRLRLNTSLNISE